MSPESFSKPDAVTLVTVTLVPDESKGLVSKLTIKSINNIFCLFSRDLVYIKLEEEHWLLAKYKKG